MRARRHEPDLSPTVRRISTIFSAAWLASEPLSSSSLARSLAASRSAERGVDPGDGGIGAVLVDELGPLDERFDHLVLGHHGVTLRPLTNRWPRLLPAAMPRSASRASPGPLTTQPITADLERDLPIAERLHRPVGHVDHVDLGPTATRAGDEVDVLALAQTERFEQLPAGTGLLHRIGGQAEYRIVSPMPSSSSAAMPAVAFDETGRWRAGLGDTEVQGRVGDLAELAVRLDHQRHVRRLHADLEVVEVDVMEVGDLLQLALSTIASGRMPPHFSYRAGSSGAAIDADPDGDRTVLRLSGDGLDVLRLADVPRIETQAVHARLHRRERHPVLVMDVGDDRDRRPGHDLGEAFCRLLLVAGAADDVAAGRRQRVDLLQRSLDVGGLGDRHRLHRDRCIAADRDLADVELPGLPAFVRHVGQCATDQRIGRTTSRYRPENMRNTRSPIIAIATGTIFDTSAW